MTLTDPTQVLRAHCASCHAALQAFQPLLSAPIALLYCLVRTLQAPSMGLNVHTSRAVDSFSVPRTKKEDMLGSRSTLPRMRGARRTAPLCPRLIHGGTRSGRHDLFTISISRGIRMAAGLGSGDGRKEGDGRVAASLSVSHSLTQPFHRHTPACCRHECSSAKDDAQELLGTASVHEGRILVSLLFVILTECCTSRLSLHSHFSVRLWSFICRKLLMTCALDHHYPNRSVCASYRAIQTNLPSHEFPYLPSPCPRCLSNCNPIYPLHQTSVRIRTCLLASIVMLRTAVFHVWCSALFYFGFLRTQPSNSSTCPAANPIGITQQATLPHTRTCQRQWTLWMEKRRS